MHRSLTILAILSTIIAFAQSLEAKPFGVAVSWVGYDNRSDFHRDRELLNLIIEGQSEESDRTRELGMFGISSSHHFQVPTHSRFLKAANADSFEENLISAVDLLIAEVEKNSDLEPYLVLAIASHGSNGQLALQYRANAQLKSLFDLLMREEDRFTRATKKNIRYEIIYSACHSGSLIDEAKPIVEARRKKKIPTGPINILTTTSTDNLAYVSPSDGDYLLNYILHYQQMSRKASNTLAWHNNHPTLAQFGFFSHLGPSFENFPQIYASDWNWTAGATVDFLNSYRFVYHRGGRNFFERELRVDLNTIFNNAKTIQDAWKVFSIQSASDYYEANFRLFEDYLSRPNKAARYAAAFAILKWTSDGLVLPTRFPHLAGLIPKARKVALEWAQDPKIKELTGDDLWFFDLTSELHIDDMEPTEVVSVLGNLYKSSSSSRRPVMDLLRKYLENRFHIRPEKKDHFRHEPAKNIDLTTIPPELSSLAVQVYFDIPLESNREETVKIAFPRSLPSYLRFAENKEICWQMMAELGAEGSFQNLFTHAIRAYDRGTYLWSQPMQIHLGL